MKKNLFFLLILFYSCSDRDHASSNCSLAPDPGLCEAYFIRYYYDQNEKQCKEFVWGGCGGVVPFQTLEECKACVEATDDE